VLTVRSSNAAGECTHSCTHAQCACVHNVHVCVSTSSLPLATVACGEAQSRTFGGRMKDAAGAAVMHGQCCRSYSNGAALQSYALLLLCCCRDAWQAAE
jgi:hypothetical protein